MTIKQIEHWTYELLHVSITWPSRVTGKWIWWARVNHSKIRIWWILYLLFAVLLSTISSLSFFLNVLKGGTQATQECFSEFTYLAIWTSGRILRLYICELVKIKFIGSIYPIFFLLRWEDQLPDTQIGEWNRQILDQTLCTTCIVLLSLYGFSYFLYRIIASFLYFYRKKNINNKII